MLLILCTLFVVGCKTCSILEVPVELATEFAAIDHLRAEGSPGANRGATLPERPPSNRGQA